MSIFFGKDSKHDLQLSFLLTLNHLWHLRTISYYIGSSSCYCLPLHWRYMWNRFSLVLRTRRRSNQSELIGRYPLNMNEWCGEFEGAKVASKPWLGRMIIDWILYTYGQKSHQYPVCACKIKPASWWQLHFRILVKAIENHIGIWNIS